MADGAEECVYNDMKDSDDIHWEISRPKHSELEQVHGRSVSWLIERGVCGVCERAKHTEPGATYASGAVEEDVNQVNQVKALEPSCH
ncbi:hypothetical protein P4O66_018301 [Electrophorus voltai]|uniref:Uncharacterized protein n=1 Tax=Electrophorus voltai TaxID=2609070 RepID=A0AAD9DL74_9TELE|nr:hypothetical protein P4O66_018301 [Electrophorus voltai]